MLVVWYISGHGFGHASRDVEIINAITRQRPDCRIVLRTAVPPAFLQGSADRPIEVQHVETDSGMVQVDSLRIDEDESARKAARFYAGFDDRVAAEAAVLRNLGASVVVGDIPPLAFAAAERAGIRSVAVGNFTWDWIYDAYPQFAALAPGVIDQIRTAYATVTIALRLPLHGGFEPMRAMIRDVPLVARHSERGRDETRRALGLQPNQVMVLPSFGGFGLELPYAEIARTTGITLVITDHEAGTPTNAHGPAGLRVVTRAERDALDLRYEDLVAAADVVVSKPGYGIVSECIANRTALLYTSRGRFAEQEMFVREMPRVVRCAYIAPEDLRGGAWADPIRQLLEQPAPAESLRTDGAAIAADGILSVSSV